MEAIRPASRSASDERNLNGSHATRPRAASDWDPIRNVASSRGTEEDRSPSTLPKAFQGMLKTTTETGEIGMFSIKPSRIPQALNSPRRTGAAYNENAQKSRQSFQPYGVPGVDDRRRLPSYTRDAASEVISMYETASQKSGNRGYEDPDHRSYSMTQTSSYSSYTLSNHRSYASLRSQPEGNGLLQRPRSPFAYPTRLKRPGFRPSSPALTDGGAIDYSRRAEIERIPYGRGHSTSSPSSLYAQKRKPPLSLRNEANRSTPSLLSQPSPRRSPSPNVRQSTGNQGSDWSRRNASTSVNTSPARSTFSLASTVNIYATAAPASTTTTPGKVHPPSPLYYDYTEDFDIDEYNRPEPLAPPPTFRIDESIPEDRPMSVVRPFVTTVAERASDGGLKSRLRTSSSAASVFQKPFEESLASSKGTQDTSTSIVFRSTIDSAPLETQPGVKSVDSKRDTKVIRLSGLGYGARELSTHVEEAFGLPSSSSFEINVSDRPNNGVGKANDTETLDRTQKEVNIQSARSSGFSMNTNIQQFPQPPENQHPSRISEDASAGQLQDSIGASLKSSAYGDPSQRPESSQNLARQERAEVSQSTEPSLTAQRNLQQHRSSGLNSVGTGWTELAELITSLESKNRPRSSDDAPDTVLTRGTPIPLPVLSDEALLQKPDSEHSTGLAQPLINHIGSKLNHSTALGQVQRRNHHHHKARKIESAHLLSEFNTANVPNFSHQIPRQLPSRSESPMLAPKPISPARQLRLKNSVPQLMKALPPLPPDPQIRAVSPPNHLASLDAELPCRFSPLSPESRSTSDQESQGSCQSNVGHETIQKMQKPDGLIKPGLVLNEGVNKKKSHEENTASPPPVQRLKLKGRNTGANRPLSPPGSRPWNLEESYPWSSQDLNVGLPSLVSEDRAVNSKPKFKLKVTRASDSTQGTIRINRNSVESKHLAGLHLRNPKDLFTPTSGLDNILRGVSRHLHSRKSSAHSIHQSSTESSSSPISTSISNQISGNATTNEDLTTSGDRSTSGIRLTPSEVQSSFSDDSSRIHGKHRLRMRLSNLRARIAVPYTTRVAAHSYDDINWNDRIDTQASPPSALRSVPNLHFARTATDGRAMRGPMERLNRRKLREKVRGWLKEARSAIVARVKTRSSNGRSDDERAQLTTVLRPCS